jgi:GT2 family glycosyltransferase
MNGALSLIVGGVIALSAVPVLAASVYLGFLAVLARRSPAPAAPRGGGRARFDVIVPAHNEEAGIERTVASLLDVDYPRELFRVIVVADNCDDETAALARRAGAMVSERHDDQNRGKGYALEHGFALSRSEGFAQSVVVVDADTDVSRNLLTAFAARIEAGEHAVQAHYGVRNAADSWRTRLLAIAFALFHGVRSLGRERLGLSCGLRGNGMAFTHEVLERVPYAAFSIVEDLEFGIQLGQHGVRVAYAAEAHVLGDMPEGERASRSQRERWERGRRTIVRQYAGALLRAAVARRDALRLDLAADLLVPPLAQLAVVVALGGMLSVGAVVLGVGAAAPGAVLWAVAALALAIYVARGCELSGLGARAFLDLLWAPVYIAWKLARLIRPRRQAPTAWVRTSRTNEM